MPSIRIVLPVAPRRATGSLTWQFSDLQGLSPPAAMVQADRRAPVRVARGRWAVSGRLLRQLRSRQGDRRGKLGGGNGTFAQDASRLCGAVENRGGHAQRHASAVQDQIDLA